MYYSSAQYQAISKKRALQELARHGLGDNDIIEFLAALGDRDVYDAQAVLAWIGY